MAERAVSLFALPEMRAGHLVSKFIFVMRLVETVPVAVPPSCFCEVCAAAKRVLASTAQSCSSIPVAKEM